MICLACGYSKSVHNKAATVCAEGVGHSDGTHGTLHTKTDEVSKKHLVL
ncbi:HNH/endonuclease VII fold toxin-2 domain-containing protein [Marinomonas rhizomae]